MYDNLTIDQIRSGMTALEESYSIAMDAGAYGLAAALKDKRDSAWKALVAKVQAQDPYTTEADIRYFDFID